MRLADAILRQGHLSEKALIAAVTADRRPPHLDRCDLCAERAAALYGWLEEVRTVGVGAADAMFADEQLKIQRAQILARLEQADEPSRVIAFPGRQPQSGTDTRGHRVAPAWLGVAAAAGVVLGIVGGQITARLGFDPTRPATAVGADVTGGDAQATPIRDVGSDPADLLDPLDPRFDQFIPESLSAIDEMMPTLLASTTAGG